MRRSKLVISVLAAIVFAVWLTVAAANGDETLGTPSIGIASGSGIVAAGTGLDSQPGIININVPGASVNQVLLYWSGVDPDDTIEVGGVPVLGEQIGQDQPSAGETLGTTFRADITALGQVNPGANALQVGGLSTGAGIDNDGAGVLVIFDDGSLADIDLRDGHDHAYINGSTNVRRTTEPVTFVFDAALSDRTASLAMFFGDVAGSGRPNAIDITVGDGVTDVVTTLNNVLGANDGQQWDTVEADVTIQAGATQLTVQAFSEDRLGVGGVPASFNWIDAALSVPPEEPPGGDGCTPGYWKNHLNAWGPTGLSPTDDFDTTFGVDLFDPDITLGDAINLKGGGVKKLGRHGTAALLNALHPDVNYPLTVAEVIALVQAGDADALVPLNELSADCPAEI